MRTNPPLGGQCAKTAGVPRIKHLAICALSLLGFVALNALANDLHVKHLTLEDGLSQTSVTGIQQDRRGFMWFATRNGLNRYDGKTFKIYKPELGNPASLSHGAVWALHIDREGTLWAGTREGLNKYDSETETFTHYRPTAASPHMPRANHVLAIDESRDGTLWIGTNGGGLSHFSPRTEVFVDYRRRYGDALSLSNDVVNTVLEDSQGILWVGTNSALQTLAPGTAEFQRPADAPEILSENGGAISALYEDSTNTIWIGTVSQGIFAYRRDANTYRHYRYRPDDPTSPSASNVVTIYEDGAGQVWFGTDGDGLIRYRSDNDTFIRYRSEPDQPSITGNRVQAIFEDQSGLLWLGILGSGIDRIGKYAFAGTTSRNSYPELTQLNTRNIRTFYQDEDRTLWVGTLDGGLIRIHRDSGRVKHNAHDPTDPSGLINNRIYRIYADRSNTIWLGHPNGWFSRYDAATDTFDHYRCDIAEHSDLNHGNVRAILEDHQGTLWIGTDAGGLHTFDRETAIFTAYAHNPNDPTTIGSNSIFALHEDRERILWVASYGSGLDRFERSTDTFKRYQKNPTDPNSIGSSYVLSIHEDPNGLFWLGTNGAGLVRFDLATELFTNYSFERGITSNLVYGALEDSEGHLWLSHDDGLSKLDLVTGVVNNYNTSDGLQANEFNGGALYATASGELIFGGISGYNAFFPSRLSANPLPPPVVITELRIFNKTLSPGETYDDRIVLNKSILATPTVTLSHTDFVFSLEYAALDYLAPERNQYAYMMEGLERNWNHVGTQSFVTYTALPPGNYVFRVKASNNNGVWNEEGATLNIVITPPYWQTWWFRTLAISALLMLGIAAYTMRMRNVRRRSEKLEHQVEVRTAELETQKNNLQDTLLELSETKDALIEAAHEAGMATTTTGVLHNVGNILNSVNTSATVLQETLHRPVVRRFAKANEILRKNIENLADFISSDPKGKKLFEYYLELEASFDDENRRLQASTARLVDKIAAIKEAVTAQQGYASGLALSERVDIQSLIEETLALQTGSISRYEVSIKRIFANDIPLVTVPKTRVVQILMNLIKNAQESMNDVVSSTSILTIETSCDEDFAYIKITDTGAGIPKEALERIFAYGFSTKRKGRGFGLHSCATYMKEMNGEMWAESDGPGHGATFGLAFPILDSDKEYNKRQAVARLDANYA